jgi:hypothetical protein
MKSSGWKPRRKRRGFQPEDFMNGYVVFVLNRMQATEAGDAILDAFELGKVDTSIITLEDVTIL